MPYTQILYQIVYSTKYREQTLLKDHRPELFRYLRGVLSKNRCHPYEIGGVEDHLHFVTHLHPSVSLSALVKDLKLSSWSLIREKGLFPDFGGWQDEYAAFTYTIKALPALVEYVRGQEEHHRHEDFLTELKGLLREHEVPFEEKYLY